MFIDEAEITVQGGEGGAGKVSFYINKKGPSGGNGGKGGDIYFVASQNVSDLKKYSKVILFKAGNGQPGGANKRLGANGKDLYLEVPINTTITDDKTKEQITLSDLNSKILVCQGGEGGMGNDSFKTSTNRTPKQATPGKPGQERILNLILKLIADYGLIGLPNAGKSSLLNILTNANVRIANYPFTTLEPNLGVYKGKILADIPGLIEGASSGKGLGIKFLKHIEKVTLLLHCISVESENSEKDYQTVVEEIGKYNKNILDKKTVILLTKTDLVSREIISEKIKFLKKFKKEILPVSIFQQNLLDRLKSVLTV